MRWLVLLALGACGRINFDPLDPLGAAGRYQLRLTFDNAGREALSGFPVLVTFDASRIDYANVQADARDLRFVDPDGTELPYEIEAWDPTGTSVIWVRVPQIDASSTTDHIFAVFGDAEATDAEDPASVWATYAGVWHLAQAPGSPTTLHDSSANHNDGRFEPSMTASSLIAGRIGPGLSFDGVDDFIEIVDSDSLDLTPLTIEAWTRLRTVDVRNFVVSKDGIDQDTTRAYNAGLVTNGFFVYQTNNLSPSTVSSCCATTGVWYGFAFTVDAAAMSHAYLDGALQMEGPDVLPLVLSTNLLLGRRGVTDAFFSGDLDEIRLAAGSRSTDWIAAQHASMTDALITYGPQEPR